MPPAFPARTFVFAASVVDFFAIYLSTSMPIQTQWGQHSKPIYHAASAIGVLLGLIDMVSVNLFYGPEIIRRVPCCPAVQRTELMPQDPEQSFLESHPQPQPPATYRTWLSYAYLPCSILKSFLDFSYFTYSFFGWIAEWRWLDTSQGFNQIPAITTALSVLTGWQMGLTVMSYFFLVFPLYATSDLQETCDSIANQPDRPSPLRHSEFVKHLATRVCPYTAALVRNLPQLVFFSPRLIWNAMKNYWGIPLALLYVGVWVKNVLTSYQMIQNFDLQTAKLNLELPAPETYIHVSRVARFFWGLSQNTERSLAFAQALSSTVKTLTAHAWITAASVAVACLPVYALSLVGEQNVLNETDPLEIPNTSPSSGSPLALETA